MDRLIAPNTVDAAHADTAPASGTPGYATDGNPATGVPATLWPSYQYNAIQEELIAIITAASLTPNKASTTQVRDAVIALFAKVNGDATKTFLVAPATASNQAVQFGQVAGVVGQCRNLKMSVAAASATATLTADEVIVESALGGLRYCVANANLTINLATVGAGGMDTGTAPVSGYVGIYLILNPTSGTVALLAVNTGPSVLPNVYGSGHMPSGFTASALLTVVPTNASGLITPCLARDRTVYLRIPAAFVLTANQATPTSVNISGVVPPQAVEVTGEIFAANGSSGTNTSIAISGDASGLSQAVAGGQPVAGQATLANGTICIATPQTIWYSTSQSSGTTAASFFIANYKI